MIDKTFVTPFDREDIYRLAGALDDVLDAMEEAADRIVLYRLDALPPGRHAAETAFSRSGGSALVRCVVLLLQCVLFPSMGHMCPTTPAVEVAAAG